MALLSYYNQKMKRISDKQEKKVASFDLPCGETCPFADICKTYVREREDGSRYIDKQGEVTCYAAKAAAAYTNTYMQRKVNLALSKTPEFVDLVSREIKNNKVGIVRIHSSGDFYNWDYLHKWVDIANKLPDVTFFGYTKNPDIVGWVMFLHAEGKLLNFHLSYSHGGTRDDIAEKEQLPTCYIITKDSGDYGVKTVTTQDNDYELILKGESFGMLEH